MNGANSEQPLISAQKKLLRMIIPCYPAFNIYSSVAKQTTALGPIMVATVVSKIDGWEVEVIDENNYRRYGPRKKDGKPDHAALQHIRKATVAAFYGGLTSTAPRLYELARFYKEQGAPTIAGGQHFVDENIEEGLNNGIDYIITGEGEITIADLLKNLFEPQPGKKNLEKIDGIAFLKEGKTIRTQTANPITDWNKLPLPDFTLLRHAKIKIYPVSWARGCGMNCEFCTVKGKTRCPTPDYVFDQITSIFERMGAKNFFIVDDLFGQNRELALTLCQKLREYQELMGVRFWITVQIRLDKAKDIELLCAMRKAGIRIVAIGYESPIPQELEAMNKKLKPDEMIKLTNVFHKVGFLVHGMFIFAYPARESQQPSTISPREHVKLFWKFIKKARIDTIQILLPVPLPGTELTRRLRDAGRIFPREYMGWEYYDGNFPLFIPDEPFTAKEMHLSVSKLMRRFYRFRYMFSIGMNVLLFPMIVFSLFDLGVGWRKWYHSWRNNIWRFVGWIILRKWSSEFKKDSFTVKLEHAENSRNDKRNTPKTPQISAS